jgi:uncharacterized membrane protein
MTGLLLSYGNLIPTTFQGIILLAFTISATAYFLAVILLSSRQVDGKGNSIPNGPVGMPVIGAFIIRLGATTAYKLWTQMLCRMLPFLISLS